MAEEERTKEEISEEADEMEEEEEEWSYFTKALCDIQDVSVPIEKSKSSTTKNRTWILIWKHFPDDFETYLTPLMEKTKNYIVNKHEESKSYSYLVGFFQFKTAVYHTRLERINDQMMLKSNILDIMEWRKSIVHVRELIRLLSRSYESKRTSYFYTREKL
jgi:hypothetical protein